jgi:hypothetical protein
LEAQCKKAAAGGGPTCDARWPFQGSHAARAESGAYYVISLPFNKLFLTTAQFSSFLLQADDDEINKQT